jgi:hypothetical protein
LEIGEIGEGEEDADVYNPPDDPPPKSQNKAIPSESQQDKDASEPMLSRKSEDGAVFSVGDDEFGNWAEEEESYLPDHFGRLLCRGGGTQIVKGKND